MVTTAGFNALLKIVEEPPEHLIFVFATTEPEKVLPTIRSRTHHYPFRLLAPRDHAGAAGADLRAGGRRRSTTRSTRWSSGPAAARPATRCRCSTSCWPAPTATGSTIQRALALLGATDVALIDDAVDALAAGDAAALFGAVEAVIDAGPRPAPVRHRSAGALPRSDRAAGGARRGRPRRGRRARATCWSGCASRPRGSAPRR